MASIRARKDNGMLFIDFRYQDKRYREQTALGDTAANRKRLQKVLDRIEADIAAATCHIPLTSTQFKTISINGNSIVKRQDFTTDLITRLLTL